MERWEYTGAQKSSQTRLEAPLCWFSLMPWGMAPKALSMQRTSPMSHGKPVGTQSSLCSLHTRGPNPGWFCPLRDPWQCLETLLVVTAGGRDANRHLVGGDQGCCNTPDSAPQQRMILPHMPIVPRLRNPGPHSTHGSRHWGSPGQLTLPAFSWVPTNGKERAVWTFSDIWA